MSTKEFTIAVDTTPIEKRLPEDRHQEAFDRIQSELENTASDIIDDIILDLESEEKEGGGETE